MATIKTGTNRFNGTKNTWNDTCKLETVKKSSKIKIPHNLSMFVLILEKIVNKLIFSVKSKQPPTVLSWRVAIWRKNFEITDFWRFFADSSNSRWILKLTYNGVIWGRQKSVLCQLGLIGRQIPANLARKIRSKGSANFQRPNSTANPIFTAKMWLRKIPEICTKRIFYRIFRLSARLDENDRVILFRANICSNH